MTGLGRLQRAEQAHRSVQSRRWGNVPVSRSGVPPLPIAAPARTEAESRSSQADFSTLSEAESFAASMRQIDAGRSFSMGRSQSELWIPSVTGCCQ
jgi:hypothetical protein